MRSGGFNSEVQPDLTDRVGQLRLHHCFLELQSIVVVYHAKKWSSSEYESRLATVDPAGSNQSSRGGNEMAETFCAEGRQVSWASIQIEIQMIEL